MINLKNCSGIPAQHTGEKKEGGKGKKLRTRGIAWGYP